MGIAIGANKLVGGALGPTKLPGIALGANKIWPTSQPVTFDAASVSTSTMGSGVGWYHSAAPGTDVIVIAAAFTVPVGLAAELGGVALTPLSEFVAGSVSMQAFLAEDVVGGNMPVAISGSDPNDGCRGCAISYANAGAITATGTGLGVSPTSDTQGPAAAGGRVLNIYSNPAFRKLSVTGGTARLPVDSVSPKMFANDSGTTETFTCTWSSGYPAQITIQLAP